MAFNSPNSPSIIMHISRSFTGISSWDDNVNGLDQCVTFPQPLETILKALSIEKHLLGRPHTISIYAYMYIPQWGQMYIIILEAKPFMPNMRRSLKWIYWHTHGIYKVCQIASRNRRVLRNNWKYTLDLIYGLCSGCNHQLNLSFPNDANMRKSAISSGDIEDTLEGRLLSRDLPSLVLSSTKVGLLHLLPALSDWKPVMPKIS